MVMNKTMLMLSSLMVGSLVLAVLSQSTVKPVAASDTNACAGAQGKPTLSQSTSVEMNGIRFETFLITKDRVEEKSSFVPTVSINQKMPLPDNPMGGFRGVRMRATNCTNEEIGFGRYGSALLSFKLLTADGQELQSSRFEDSIPESQRFPRGLRSAPDSWELEIGLVKVKPGESFYIGSGVRFVQEDKNVTMRLSQTPSSSGQAFHGLQPGKTYQLKLTYSNDPSKTTLKRTTQQPKIWTKNVNPPVITFRLE
jgi:hypothetical protein